MSKKRKSIESYDHSQKERVNNPPVGLVTPETDPASESKTYHHDPHIDPFLSWAGKEENLSFEVNTVSLHVHERIDPQTIVENVKKNNSEEAPLLSLFSEQELPLRKAIEFYKHRNNWTNRLIAGDSLLVMNSLLEKEGLGKKLQMVYFDPPYGIKYGSNFQPFVGNLSVTDQKDEHLTQEPEMIKAFRDTWELGIHSYLTYLRNRLLLAKDLLKDSGSIFVQIGKENVHRVAIVLEEIFGIENRVGMITYAPSGSSSAKHLSQDTNFILWFAKDKDEVKFRQLYESRDRKSILGVFRSGAWIQDDHTNRDRPLSKEEKDNPDLIPKHCKIYQALPLSSQGYSKTGRSEPYIHCGKEYKCPRNRHWSVSHDGIDRLVELNRIVFRDTGLSWKLYDDEHPGRKINDMWAGNYPANQKVYVVQTSTRIIQRCMLMSTDPGDLVFDPTCGSGTTAFVAEQWGRRWITCDTSRVALTLAKQRLMTSVFDYYKLARPQEGVGTGFQYKTVKTVSAAILAYDQPKKEITLYDQPYKDNSKKRVTGPFTVEAVPAPMVQSVSDLLDSSPRDGKQPKDQPADNSVSREGETIRQSEWREELLKSGIQGKNGRHLKITDLEPIPTTQFIHAQGIIITQNTDIQVVTVPPPEFQSFLVSFGPAYAPLEQRQVSRAIEEAQSLVPQPKLIVFAAFQFDPEAAKDIDQTNWPGVTLIKAQMNSDLLTADLRKKTKSQSFWQIGQPDVKIEKQKDANQEKYQVIVQGFDYYDTVKGELTHGGTQNIAMWMLDSDYDGRSLFPKQVFLPKDDSGKGWQKLAKTLQSEIDPALIKKYHGTKSLPFVLGNHERIAVKIIDDRGIESLKIIDSKDFENPN